MYYIYKCEDTTARMSNTNLKSELYRYSPTYGHVLVSDVVIEGAELLGLCSYLPKAKQMAQEKAESLRAG